MELICGLHNLRPEHRGCAVTIGNFDGVHRGHQAVLAHLAGHARALRVPALVMLFEPQPAEYFQPAAAPARLMQLREKIEVLRTQPVERALCLRFNAALAQLEPEQFIDEVLVQALAARYVVVGDDFRFGRARRGDMTMLRAAGARHGFDAASMPTFDVGGERVSSTRVRQALARGDFADVEALLGRAYRLSGRVVRGEQIGRRIGIPTANIELRRRRIPLAGIFVVEVDGLAPQPLPAVASIGTRPTVGGTEPLLEVHLLDYAKDIYGARISVLFRTKLRDEQRFDSVAEMAQQIQLDIAAARAFFQIPPARSQFHH